MITVVKPWQGAEVETARDRTWSAVLIAGLAALTVKLCAKALAKTEASAFEATIRLT